MDRSSPSKGARRRAWFRACQDRVRNPSLTLLLILQLFLMFVALPLAAKDIPVAERVAQSLLALVLFLVVLLSHRGVAILIIALGMAAIATGFAFGPGRPPTIASLLTLGGIMLAFSALIWVVAHAVFAPAASPSIGFGGLLWCT